MKSHSFLIVLCIISFGMHSCCCKKPVAKTQDIRQLEVMKTAPGEEILDLKFPYTIDTVWVDNLILHADLSYTGEKSDIEFKLVFNGMWLKTYPPKATLQIVPVPSTTSGRKKVLHHLTFDLKPLEGNKPFEVSVTGYEKQFRIGDFE